MGFSWYPIQLSFFVATLATVSTLITSILAVRWLIGKNFKGKQIIETVIFLPLVLPPTVIGFLLIIVFGKNSPIGTIIEWLTGTTIIFTVPAAVIASSVIAFPLMYQSIKTGFLSVDHAIIDAAKVDGASNWQLLLWQYIPLSFRAILSGIVLSFTRAFGEFGATLMFAGNIPGHTQTIPTAIFFSIESGDLSSAWYYVIISILFSFVLLGFTNFTRAGR
ncbi:molybdate ABC transporter permease subunit [Bacillus andreraoultii]|uniref:molybdate ABC transporter permease subunit n=1 Tax=Bacillus andreraoultii TaxID=1499685 RepID=UPI000539E87F|nr:molybdate ABC transporter permease subunit [Bacillus andreraoultii]